LEAATAVVRRNQDLVRLRDNLACEFVLEQLAERAPDAVRLTPLFKQWGFRSMLAELEASQMRQEALC
jgi:hypothetical protein